MSRNNGGRAAAGKKQPPESDDKSVKVKYISSPVMMEAKNPSQFKEIVQHFTGRTPSESSYGRYSNTGTTMAATTTASATTTTNMDATYQLYAYGPSSTNQQLAIDGYSWEEIAEWNQSQ